MRISAALFHPAASLGATVLGVFFGGAVLAGPLAVDTTAMAGFHGTATYAGVDNFNKPTGLSGTMDYAVWSPGTFPLGFAGYVPTPGTYTYTYQVRETGSALVSGVEVRGAPGSPILSDIGDFTGNNGFGVVVGQTTPFVGLFGGAANWGYQVGNEIAPGGMSDGLAFSSFNAPEFSLFAFSTISNDATEASVQVPTPIPSSPEPDTVTLAFWGFAILVIQWLRRRAGDRLALLATETLNQSSRPR